MSTTDKKQRIALVKKLKEKGISPAERSNSSDYKEVIKNVGNIESGSKTIQFKFKMIIT